MAKRAGGGDGAGRRMRLLLVAPLALLIALPGSPLPGGVRTASAQERPRTIMDMLFGSPSRRTIREYDPPRRMENRKVKPRQAKRDRSAAKSRSGKARPRTEAAAAGAVGVAGAASSVEAGPVEKSATAKTVVVVGDFMAGSLAGGLTEALAANPGAQIANAADGSSGLVRLDHLDWVSKVGPLIDEKKPSAVVVMLGSNDRQPITIGSTTYSPGTEDWSAEYARRADALAKAIDAKDVPLVWVGMPSFKFDRMSADMASFNEIYRKAAASVGGEYVDVWDGFVDANGAFSYSGPDIAGQQARLRNEDGITMTPEGSEKLAFFAQKPVFRLLGTAAIVGPSAPEEVAAASTAVARPANATSAPLVGFDDPALDGGEALLGGAAASLAAAESSPRQRLVVSGEPMATPIGRADDFNWSGKTEAVAPLRGTDDVVSRGSVELQRLKAAQGTQPPKPMPTLADAIIDDWEAQNAAEAGKASAPPAEARPPAAPGPASPAPVLAPISASPFPVDQTPR